MKEDGLFQSIQALPKIDLHRHMEGSVRLETLIDIAREYGIEMPTYEVETLRPFVQVTPGQPHTWRNFLNKFQTLRQFYRSPSVIRRVAHEAVADAAADNVRYLELRFTPQALTNILGCKHHDVVAWVCETVQLASEEHSIETRLILSMNRHESVEIGEMVLQAALDHREHGVVALDLAGRESEHPGEPFRPLFQRAKDEGLYITIHAGEWAGAESVYEAVNDLGADRIGHGVRALEDPEMIELLLEREIALEICPTSNIQSGVFSGLETHPLPELYRQQVRTTINTDDPLISNITLSDEIMSIVSHTSLTMEDVKQQMRIAAQSAFLGQDSRTALLAKFETWYGDNGLSPE